MLRPLRTLLFRGWALREWWFVLLAFVELVCALTPPKPLSDIMTLEPIYPVLTSTGGGPLGFLAQLFWDDGRVYAKV